MIHSAIWASAVVLVTFLFLLGWFHHRRLQKEDSTEKLEAFKELITQVNDPALPSGTRDTITHAIQKITNPDAGRYR